MVFSAIFCDFDFDMLLIIQGFYEVLVYGVFLHFLFNL
ncbi:hypothetical protein FLJC2902T_22540 [Flavobacterium limnosediminis JC2902]|uniref:Uncharacterized protein n=1 Tax=Flavobacterium limnosediminis JC2902 TaxID=1341181 RepID=V6SKE6_9FLAO|nr:hypothetical protein FLJC2902T_22540 [Flavobacterium limnosediminis JC2902]